MSEEKKQGGDGKVQAPAQTERQRGPAGQDSAEPDETGTAKPTTTVRGHGESQSVRHSG